MGPRGGQAKLSPMHMFFTAVFTSAAEVGFMFSYGTAMFANDVFAGVMNVLVKASTRRRRQNATHGMARRLQPRP